MDADVRYRTQLRDANRREFGDGYASLQFFDAADSAGLARRSTLLAGEAAETVRPEILRCERITAGLGDYF